MTKESDAMAAILAAGWNQDQAATAFAIAKAESGLNPTAKGGPNNNGSYDWGLFQINDIHSPTAEEKTQAVPNAKRAYRIYQEAGSFRPWATFNSGAYKKFMGDGQAAIDGNGTVIKGDGAIPTPSGGGPTLGSLNPLDGISQTLSKFGASVLGFLNISLALIVGVVLIGLGFFLVNRNVVGKVAGGVVGQAVGGAVKGVTK